MMLSDGSLKKDKRCVNSNASLQIEQKDRDFVELLWDLFNSIGIVGAKPRLVTRKGGFYSYAFKTFALPFFTELFTQWYKLACLDLTVQKRGSTVRM
jgi:hypothetical protein